MYERKTYLGDAVYASYDGYMIKLTTEDGAGADPTTNVIYLEPLTVSQFLDFLKKIQKEESENQ